MAIESGLGWTTLTVDDSAGAAQAGVKDDVTDLSFATPRAVQDITTVGMSAHARLLLLADYSITLSVLFNDAANQAHAVFKTVPSTSVARTVTLTVSAQTLANEVLFTDYPLKRGNGGELTAAVPGVLAGGVVPTWS